MHLFGGQTTLQIANSARGREGHGGQEPEDGLVQLDIAAAHDDGAGGDG